VMGRKRIDVAAVVSRLAKIIAQGNSEVLINRRRHEKDACTRSNAFCESKRWVVSSSLYQSMRRYSLERRGLVWSVQYRLSVDRYEWTGLFPDFSRLFFQTKKGISRNFPCLVGKVQATFRPCVSMFLPYKTKCSLRRIESSCRLVAEKAVCCGFL